MRRAAAALALALAACGRLGFDEASPAGDAASALADAARATCPGMAGDVRDEDRDLVGDPCDVCPHVGDAGQADADGDRVGDACDPEPAIARQRITFFDGFHDALPELDPGGELRDGQLVIDVVDTGSSTVLQLPTGPSVLHLGGTITALGPIGVRSNQLFIGVVTGVDDLFYVELIDDGTGRRRALMQGIDNASFTQLDGLYDPGIGIEAGPFELVLATGADRLDARVGAAGTTPATLGATGTGPTAGMQSVIYVEAMALAFDFLIQIDTLP